MKIKFEGKEYWFLGDSFNESSAIAPLEHCDKKGEILPECVFEESFAHYFPDRGILRFGEKIGDEKDLEVVK